MPKQPLFPHRPKKEPLFPHVPKGQKVEDLPQTGKIKHFWVEMNPEGTWAIVEAFPGGTIRSPFKTKEEAIKREEQIAEAYEWKVKLVPSPQEKFPKQHEVLKGFYPYEVIEYHDDGDLTIQSYEPLPRPKVGFKKGYIFVVTIDGEVFKQEYLPQIELLASTEGDPIRKFCCRQCGECAPAELLEEGKFPDRMEWLRKHYSQFHRREFAEWGQRK